MNYEPNKTEWPVGSFVIHDADAKSLRMLMQVFDSSPATNVYQSFYVYGQSEYRKPNIKSWRNGRESLHNPAQFGIDPLEPITITMAAVDWMRVADACYLAKHGVHLRPNLLDHLCRASKQFERATWK